MLRRSTSVFTCLLATALAAQDSPVLQVTVDNLENITHQHPIMLVSFGVPNCPPCDALNKELNKAANRLKLTEPTLKLGKLVLTSTDAPIIGKTFGRHLNVPKLLLYRHGEPMDYTSEMDANSIINFMTTESTRPNIQVLKTAKSAERFISGMDVGVARVVGFFSSRASYEYAVYRKVASKMQGLLTFGECLDETITKRFLGGKTPKALIQIVKADKRERKITYTGDFKVVKLSKWVGTHSMPIFTDITDEQTLQKYFARGLPTFLMLMPDSYEDNLPDILAQVKPVAQSVRDDMVMAYGFKETEPWPHLAQALGVPRDGTGAFWMIMGADENPAGRDWNQAYLGPVGLNFIMYKMQTKYEHGDGDGGDITKADVQDFLSEFMDQVKPIVAQMHDAVEDEIEWDPEKAAKAEEEAAAKKPPPPPTPTKPQPQAAVKPAEGATGKGGEGSGELKEKVKELEGKLAAMAAEKKALKDELKELKEELKAAKEEKGKKSSGGKKKAKKAKTEL